jgi:Domain of unknown function (DUF1905)
MEPDNTFQFEAPLWLYATTKAPWYFITVPQDISASIRFFAASTNGFGSVRVRASIGATHWKTSLFPDKKSGCYFLPVKAAVRVAQAIKPDDLVSVTLRTE